MICVCAQIRKDGHMEENTQKFLERMNELVALGKKKKSILDVCTASHTSANGSGEWCDGGRVRGFAERLL